MFTGPTIRFIAKAGTPAPPARTTPIHDGPPMIDSGSTEPLAGTLGTSSDARYEYRIWPTTLPRANAHLQNGWTLERCEARSDIYLLSSFSTRQIIKLRDGERLELKSLIGMCGALQLWEVPLATGFPLGLEDLRRVDECLNPAQILNPAARLSPSHLIADLTQPRADVAILNVRKSRALFTRDGCRAEITQVRVAGKPLMTFAIEDPDPDHARRIVRELELEDLPNRDYGDVLRAAAGIGGGSLPVCTPMGDV